MAEQVSNFNKVTEIADAIQKIVDLIKSLNPERSVILEVQNRTDGILRRVAHHHDDGGFATLPSLEIPPGAVDIFGSHDNSFHAGTQGSVTYESTSGFLLTITWDNPIFSSPTCDAAVTAGSFQVTHTCGVGEPANMQYVVEPGFTPDSILRKSTAEAGEVREIAVANFATQGILTAVSTKAGTLKLIPWEIASDGSITRKGDGAEAGAASQIDIARGQKFVTALSNGGGNLMLISWEVDPDGNIERKNQAEVGEADLIRITALTDTLFVTAFRDGSDRLRLLTWELATDGGLTKRGDSLDQAGVVEEVSLVRFGVDPSGNHIVITAVRGEDTVSGGNDLLVIAWRISPDGFIIERRSFQQGQAGNAKRICSVIAPSGVLVTSMEDGANLLGIGDGKLLLITWQVDLNGNIKRLADSHGQAGNIDANSLMRRPLGVLSAVNTGNGVKLIGWKISQAGAIVRLADSGEQAGKASNIALAQEPVSGDGPIVSAFKTEGNNLMLRTWVDHQ